MQDMQDMQDMNLWQAKALDKSLSGSKLETVSESLNLSQTSALVNYFLQNAGLFRVKIVDAKDAKSGNFKNQKPFNYTIKNLNPHQFDEQKFYLQNGQTEIRNVKNTEPIKLLPSHS